MTPGEDNRLLDYLPDTQNAGSDTETFEHALTEGIDEVLATLKEREARILRLYFGLEGPEPMTLEEIGTLLGHHPGAGSTDQGKGAEPPPPRQPCQVPRELPVLGRPRFPVFNPQSPLPPGPWHPTPPSTSPPAPTCRRSTTR